MTKAQLWWILIGGLALALIAAVDLWSRRPQRIVVANSWTAQGNISTVPLTIGPTRQTVVIEHVPTPVGTDLLINRTQTATGSFNPPRDIWQTYPNAPTEHQTFTQSKDAMLIALEFQDKGRRVATLTGKHGRVIYTLEGKEVGRNTFYRWMDAWVLKWYPKN